MPIQSSATMAQSRGMSLLATDRPGAIRVSGAAPESLLADAGGTREPVAARRGWPVGLRAGAGSSAAGADAALGSRLSAGSAPYAGTNASGGASLNSTSAGDIERSGGSPTASPISTGFSSGYSPTGDGFSSAAGL